jgi:hypothetical protein
MLAPHSMMFWALLLRAQGRDLVAEHFSSGGCCKLHERKGGCVVGERYSVWRTVCWIVVAENDLCVQLVGQQVIAGDAGIPCRIKK